MGDGLGALGPASIQKRPPQGWGGGWEAWGMAARGGHPPPTGPLLGPQPCLGLAAAHSGGWLGPQLALPQGHQGPGQVVPGPLGGAGVGYHSFLVSHPLLTFHLY